MLLIQLTNQLYTYYSNLTQEDQQTPIQAFEPQQETQIYSLKSLNIKQNQSYIEILTSNTQSNTLTIDDQVVIPKLQQLSNWTIDCQDQKFCLNILERQISNQQEQNKLIVVNSIINNWQQSRGVSIDLIFINCTFSNLKTVKNSKAKFYNSEVLDSEFEETNEYVLFNNSIISNTQFKKTQIQSYNSKFDNINVEGSIFQLEQSQIVNSQLQYIQLDGNIKDVLIKNNNIVLNQSLTISSQIAQFQNVQIKQNKINIEQSQYLFNSQIISANSILFVSNEIQTQIQQFYIFNTLSNTTNLDIHSNIIPQIKHFALIQTCGNGTKLNLEMNIDQTNVQQINIIENLGTGTFSDTLSDSYIKVNYNVNQQETVQGQIALFCNVKKAKLQNIILDEQVRYQVTEQTGINSTSYLSLLANSSIDSSYNNLYVYGNLHVFNYVNQSQDQVSVSLISQQQQNIQMTNSIYDLQELDLEYINSFTLVPSGSYENTTFQSNIVKSIYNGTPTSGSTTQKINYQTLYGQNLTLIFNHQYQAKDKQVFTNVQYQEPEMTQTLTQTVQQNQITNYVESLPSFNYQVQVKEATVNICGQCYEVKDQTCQLSDTCTVNNTEWLNLTNYQKGNCQTQENISFTNIDKCVLGVYQCKNGFGGTFCDYEISTAETEIQQEIQQQTAKKTILRDQDINETNQYYNVIIQNLISITKQLEIEQPEQPQNQTIEQMTQAQQLESYMQQINQSLFDIAQNATRTYLNEQILQTYQIQDLEQLQNESQQLLLQIQKLAGDHYNETSLDANIQYILNEYTTLFDSLLELCLLANASLYNENKISLEEWTNQTFQSYYQYKYSFEWWTNISQNCIEYNQLNNISDQMCDEYVAKAFIENMTAINQTADQMQQLLNDINDQIQQEYQKRTQLIQQQKEYELEIQQINEQIINKQKDVDQAQSKYDQANKKSNAMLYSMIAIVVITVLYNVALCLFYFVYPKYKQQKLLKKRINSMEMHENAKKEKKDQESNSQSSSQTEEYPKYKSVPKQLPKLKSKKPQDEQILQETINPIDTIFGATQLNDQQKQKYVEEQLKLEKGKHEQIYDGESVNIDTNLIGILQRSQIQPNDSNLDITKRQLSITKK